MKSKSNIRIVCLLIASVALVHIGESAAKSPEERLAKIETAAKLLDRSVVVVGENTVAMIRDPFGLAPEPIEVVEEVVEIKELSPQELMPLLAKNVKPTGIFSTGGVYYLMFKEEKLTSGGIIPVVYQDKEYNLEIVSVVRNAFSLRFGDAELDIKLK